MYCRVNPTHALLQRVFELGAPCLAGTGCARLRQAKRAQQRLVDPGQLSANTLIARTEGVEVTAMMSLSKETQSHGLPKNINNP